ncbi:MAG TPA: thioredoxin family protein [Candidatus Angelobacter sp.]|nr:thioredoxin family protein [Candidatus Angelobacter sp.]
MRARRHAVLAVIAVLVLAAAASAQWKKTPLQPPAQKNPQLYDTNANASDEIREAVAAGGKDHKRILLVFGGNWCLDCHVLDNAFRQPRIAPMLNSGFIVVHVDVGEYTKNLDLAAKYHVDLKKGVPSIAVLESNGGFLYSTSEFERARVLSEEDVIEFLNKWKPTAAAAKS